AGLLPRDGPPGSLGVLTVEAGDEHVSRGGGEGIDPFAPVPSGGRGAIVRPGHGVSPIRYCACAAAIGRPVRFSTQPQVPQGLFSKNTHCPAGVTAKSKEPNAMP